MQVTAPVPQYTLAQAIAIALREGGPALLDAPKRLVAYVTDLANANARDVYVFAGNCDENLLGPYARAVREGTSEAVERAAYHAEALLTDRRCLVKDVSRDVARSIACAVAYVMGVKLPASYGSTVIPYDVFVCCREVVESTGARTGEGALAAHVRGMLVQAGLRVFYPRVSLVREGIECHDDLTREALDASKVLLVVCSDVRHLGSAWVQAQLERFRATHAPEQIAFCVWGFAATQLPPELRALPVLEVAENEFPEQAVRRVIAMTRVPATASGVSRGGPSSGGSSQSSVQRADWLRTNELRYCTEDVRCAQGSGLALLMRPIKLGGTDVTATFESGGAPKKHTLRGLCPGDEGLVIADGGARFVAILSKGGEETQRSIVLKLSWYEVSRTDGTLVLRMANRAQRICALNDVTLLVEGTPRSVVRLGSQGILMAGATKTLSVRLDGWAASALSGDVSYELYVFGRKVPRMAEIWPLD